MLVAEADPAGTNARSANAEPTPLAAPDAGDGVAFVAYPIRAGDVLTMRLRFGVNVGMTMPLAVFV